MRTILFTCLALCLQALLPVPVQGQHQFTLGGEFRPRLEQRHGYRTLAPTGSKSAFFISERLRLSVSYANPHFKFFATIQDVRTWGNEEQVKSIGSFGLHEGWAELYVKDKVTFKLGRQEIAYDDHRLLGNLDWAQAGRSHDGLVIRVNHKQARLDVGGIFNQSGEPLLGTVYKLNNYKALVYGWYQQRMDSGRLNLAVYAIGDGLPNKDSLPTTFFRFTAGPHLVFQYPHFRGNVTAYIQSGKTTANQKILAWFASVYGAYVRPKITLGVGLDYVSGNNASKSGKFYQAFNTLYATNHKFYGHMDYFLDLPTDTKLGGLQDLYLRFQYQPKPKGMAGFDAHAFFLGNKVADAAAPGQYLDLPLGFEFDLYGQYSPFEFVDLKAGYSFLIATPSMEMIKGGSRKAYNGWSFVMLTIKPAMFKWEKQPEKAN